MVEANFPRGTTNQKHYRDMGRVKLIRFLCARVPQLSLRGETCRDIAKSQLFSYDVLKQETCVLFHIYSVGQIFFERKARARNFLTNGTGNEKRRTLRKSLFRNMKIFQCRC